MTRKRRRETTRKSEETRTPAPLPPDDEQTLTPYLHSRLEEIQELIRTSATLLPVKVGDVVIEKAIPAMVEAMSSQVSREFSAFIPVMVQEVLKILGHNIISRSLPHHVKSSKSKSLKLNFVGALPDTLLTFNNIQDEGAFLKVELQDSSGSRVEAGPEASVKIKIVVLDGDFEVEDTDDWTREDFDKNVAQPRKHKGALLKGNCDTYMTNGVASVSDIAFTDNSKFMRNGKFRLGARAVKGLPAGVEIRDAVSGAFKVKERRVKFYRKHKRPSLEDGTDCLVHVGKTLCQKLADREIHTVKDFLQLYHTDANKLQNILQLASNKWSELVKNTELCSLSDEYYQHYDEASGVDLLLDCVFNVARVIFNGQVSQAYTDLDDSQKQLVDKIRHAAYEKRKELTMIRTSKEAESVCRSIIQPSNIQHLDAPAADRTPLVSSVNPNVNIMLEGQDLCRIAPNQTDQVIRCEPCYAGEQELRNPVSPRLAAGRELLSLMPSEPGMPVDKTQDSYYKHQSSVSSANSNSFECTDAHMTKQSRLFPVSDSWVVLLGTIVPKDPESHCDAELKRQRLG